MRVGILGAGQFGTALAWLAGSNGHEVMLYTRRADKARSVDEEFANKPVFHSLALPSNVRATQKFGPLFAFSKYVILAVPVHALRAALVDQTSLIGRETVFINVAKGMEQDGGLTVSEILDSIGLGDRPYGVLSGPNFAVEIIRRVPTATVVASQRSQVIESARELFGNELFRIYGSNDVTGVELAGALKNVLAIAVGVHDSLRLGNNSRAALVTRGTAEITRLVLVLGGKSETMLGLSGWGDIYLTTTSNLSRNYQLGTMVGKGLSLDVALHRIGSTVEAIHTVESALVAADKLGIEMPITQVVHDILYAQKNPRSAILQLMERPWKKE